MNECFLEQALPGRSLNSLLLDVLLQAHNAKRVHRLQTSVRTKKEKEDAQQAVWEARFKARSLEAERKKHEDSLRFFAVRVVSLCGRWRGKQYTPVNYLPVWAVAWETTLLLIIFLCR